MHEAMLSYKSAADSLFDPTKLTNHSFLRPEVHVMSNCSYIFKKLVTSDNTVCFIVDNNVVSYVKFDCGISLHLEFFLKKQGHQPRMGK